MCLKTYRFKMHVMGCGGRAWSKWLQFHSHSSSSFVRPRIISLLDACSGFTPVKQWGANGPEDLNRRSNSTWDGNAACTQHAAMLYVPQHLGVSKMWTYDANSIQFDIRAMHFVSVYADFDKLRAWPTNNVTLVSDGAHAKLMQNTNFAEVVHEFCPTSVQN